MVKKFFNDLIGDISEAADKLETDLDDDAFEMEIHSKKHKKFDVETVVKVTGEQTSGWSSSRKKPCLSLFFRMQSLLGHSIEGG